MTAYSLNRFIKWYVLAYLVGGSLYPLLSQSSCNISVMAGPDLVICEGESGQLNGSITGNYNTFEWVPPTGLSDPFDLNTSVTTSIPMSYKLVARGEGSNLMINGGFETGALPPATTGFSFVPVFDLPLSPGGSYTIGSSVAFGNIWGCATHGGTFAMAYNGTGTSGANIWCQTVPVVPNTDYKAEAWLMSIVIPLFTTAPAISIEINGGVVGSTVGSSTLSCSWSNATGVWNSGGASSATLCIVSNNGGMNFGGLDDISLVECCVVEDEVMVDVERVDAIIQAAGPIRCDQPTLMLDASGSSSGTGYRYEWSTTDGVIIGGGQTLNPTIGAPGTYTLKVISPSGCEKEAEVIIEGSVTPPDVRTFDVTLSCDQNPVRVVATSKDPEVRFSWTGPNGFTSLDASFTTSQGGMYYVTAEDNYGCISMDSALVIDERSFPEISIQGDTLFCGKDSVTLESKSPSWRLTYEWQLPDGTLSADPKISSGDTGLFILTVIDSNGCTGSDSFYLQKFDLNFNVFATADTITCLQSFANLVAHSDSSNVEYLWIGPNGFISHDSATQVVDTGTYILTITLDGLCSKSDTVEVMRANDVPVFEILNDTIDCSKDSAYLKVVTNESDVNFEWLGPGGFSSLKDNIVVVDSGLYTLTVSSITGCQGMKSVRVRIDQEPPVFHLKNDTLTCIDDSLFIEIQGLSNDDILDWMGPNGFSSNGLNHHLEDPGEYIVHATGKNHCTYSDTFLIYRDQSAPLISLPFDTINCLKTEIELTAINTKINTWQWSGPNGFSSDSNAVIVYQAGIYSLLVIGHNGCDTMISTTIEVDTVIPDLTLSADTIDCGSPEIQITLTSNQNGRARWEGPDLFFSNSTSPIVYKGGWYFVRFYPTNGCQTLDSIFIVQEGNLPDAAAFADTITCLTDSVELQGNSLTPNVTYQWKDESGSIISMQPNHFVKKGGQYTLEVITDNGCVGVTTVNVVVDTLRPQILDLSFAPLNCDSTFTNLKADVVDAASLEFMWTGPGGFTSSHQNPRVSDIGWYYLTVISLNGCESLDSVFLVAQDTRPDVILEADTITCGRDTALLFGQTNASNVTYFWTGPNGFQSNNLVTKTTVPGIYTLSITDINDCSGIDSITVEEDYTVSESTILLDTLWCPLSTAKVVVTSTPTNTRHSWIFENKPISMSNILSTDQAGIYTLITTHPVTECHDTQKVEIFQSPDSIKNVIVKSRDLGCSADSGLIEVVRTEGGHLPLMYTLNNGVSQISPIFDGLDVGQYDLTITDRQGCTWNESVSIAQLKSYLIDIEEDFEIRKGESRLIAGIITIPDSLIQQINWTPEMGLSCAECQFPTASPNQTSTYFIEILDVNGCIYRDTLTITVISDLHTYLPNIFSPNGDGLNDIIYLQSNEEARIEYFTIFDRWGEKVFHVENGLTNDPEFGWDGLFNGQKMASGVYIGIAKIYFKGQSHLIKTAITIVE